MPGIHDSRERRLASIPGNVPENYGEMVGCRFAPRCPWAEGCAEKNYPVTREIAPGHFTRCVRGNI